MTISSQIPGACKTGSSERIQKYNRVHLPIPHRSIVSKFCVSTFRPLMRAIKKKRTLPKSKRQAARALRALAAALN